VVCPHLDGWHIECKRVQRLNLAEAMAQAIRDADGKRPVVMHRRNQSAWLVTLSLDDFLALLP
jgi:hypothetical protein